jgi:predicted 3-demethylubiquinone-9 3-methyltransferase (glyoxalase superfamily)
MELLSDKDKKKSARVMAAMMTMHKIDIATLLRAAAAG